jgi:hypothetical protein
VALSEKEGGVSKSVLDRLVARYRELEACCYRANVCVHGPEGRDRRDPRQRQVSAALMKKMDLDRVLVLLYRRFFGSE